MDYAKIMRLQKTMFLDQPEAESLQISTSEKRQKFRNFFDILLIFFIKDFDCFWLFDLVFRRFKFSLTHTCI